MRKLKRAVIVSIIILVIMYYTVVLIGMYPILISVVASVFLFCLFVLIVYIIMYGINE